MSSPKLYINKITNNATIPTRGSKYAAGYDLYSAYDYTILANGKELIKTDLSMTIPIGYYGRIAPRSGFSWKKHTDIGAGVIDCDYTGNVGVIIFNHSSDIIKVKKGDRIAQLILTPYYSPRIIETTQIQNTTRGSGGFGSTGMN